MHSLFGGSVPEETEATCSSCSMLDAAAPPRGDTSFDPGIKCCTFEPALANFLVGGVLRDPCPEPAARVGKASIEARISRGLGVTPLGLARSPVFAVLYKNSREAFGRARSLRCPHYVEEGGLCGVWRHRESTCATWFCKHVRGATAKSFWDQLQHLLRLVEGGLARHCVIELDPGARALQILLGSQEEEDRALGVAELDARLESAPLAAAWGSWAGREREFYGRAADLIAGLDWRAVLGVGGAGVRGAAAVAGQSYREVVAESLPERVELGRFEIVGMRGDQARISTYSEYDALEVSLALLEVLPYFEEAASTREAIARAGARTGIELDDAAVLRLIDFGILVARED
jgi:hypothetical protein